MLCWITEHLAVLFLTFLGNTSASSRRTELQLTRRLYTFESSVRADISNGFDSSSDSRVAFGTLGKFSTSTLYTENAESSACSLLIFQLEFLKFVPSIESDGLYHEKVEKSELESAKNEPFLVQFCTGRFKNIFLDSREDVSIRNVKKAIAAIFQYQTLSSQSEETDVSGLCQMSYEKINDSTILKRKDNCEFQSAAFIQAEPVFATMKNVTRRVLYRMDENNPSELVRATAHDDIDVYSAVRKDLRISIVSSLDIIFSGTSSGNTREFSLTNAKCYVEVNYHSQQALKLKNSPFANLNFESIQSVEEALNYVIKTLELDLEPDTLHLNAESSREKLNSLKDTIEMNRKFINESLLGFNQSSTAFLEILNAALLADERDIISILKDEKNEPVLNQLMDIFGCAQTQAVHTAIMKTFDFKDTKNIDPIERYLWAVSVNEKPNLQFLRDLLEMYHEMSGNEKLKDTLLLTVTALAQKMKSEELKVEIYQMIRNGIKMCPKNDECISSYLRALKNLKYAGAKSFLLQYSLTGSRRVSTNALKAVYNLPRNSWDDQVLKVAEKIYYQKDRLYDSSARSIAVDILVDAGPDYESLHNLVRSLQSNTSYETRKYLLQRLQQVASTDEAIDRNLCNLMKQRNLFNYNFLAQKGLSNAIRRPILRSDNLNASIITINEVSKSVLKRGHVGVILEQSDNLMELITLDLFTSGLSSFLWSDDSSDDEEMDEPEELLAGIEIALYGVQIRPFFFFRGHAELMGHIWAGTASERTPILQALRLLLATKQIIPLSSGYTAKTDLMGAISFKLAGRITFSLWNRNAYSLGEASIATTVAGSVFISAHGVEKELNSKLVVESQIDMASDLDFYDEVLFCLQISQPRTTVDYEFEMRHGVPDTNSNVHRRKKINYAIPGNTMNLNKKNNEMCNSILLNNSKS